MIRVPAILAGLSCLLIGTGANAQEFQSPEDVSFLSQLDGTEQRYVILLPEGFDAERPARRDDCPAWARIAIGGSLLRTNGQNVREPATWRCSENMIFVSPDYRAKTSWMGPAAEADLLQILDELNSRFRIRDVVISGGSMGGTSALAFAAMHPDCVDGVVALNGTANLIEYPNFTEAIAESYGGTKAEKPEVYRERSAELFPERLTMPVAVTTGGKDTLVPPESTLRLVRVIEAAGVAGLVDSSAGWWP